MIFLQMTILSIGSHLTIKNQLIRRNSGFTFIEVMVALIILSAGIVSVLKVFIFSMDQLSYLSNRVYADILLDNKMVQMSRVLNAYNALNMNDLKGETEMNVGSKEIAFKEDFKISEIEGLSGLFQLECFISWNEKSKNIQLSKAGYLSNIHFTKD